MITNYGLYEIGKKNNITIDDINYKNKINIEKVKKNMNFILNLQDEDDNGNGSHWVALLKRGSNFFYFDSFGAKPHKRIINLCHNLSKCKGTITYNNYIIQNITTEICGYYCFGLLYYCKKATEKTLLNLCNEFVYLFEDDTTKNKDILFNYYKIKKIKL